ncbi:MAG: threonine-phosphate decarboxylase CobD [Oscillospiraceae bacterium]
MNRYAHGGDIYGSSNIRHDFSVNLNPLGMPREVIETIRQNAADFSAYPDSECRALRKALAAQHGIDASHILCGNGAADIILRLCMALKPKTVLTLAPSFSEYDRAARLCGADIKRHTLCADTGFVLTDAVLDEISGDVRLVFICNPNNPNGALADPALLTAILRRCEQVGAVLAVDECFLPFINAESMSAQLESPALVVICAFTKLYAMAGLRLGYMLCSNEDILRRVSECGQSWSVSSVAQAAGLSALNCRDYTERTKALIAKEREYLRAGLESLGVSVFPSSANFLLCRHSMDIFQLLLARGILIRSCENFEALDSSYFRVCVSQREGNTLLLSEISEVLNG